MLIMIRFCGGLECSIGQAEVALRLLTSTVHRESIYLDGRVMSGLLHSPNN